MAAVPDTAENMARCICGSCPSFPGDGGFYCAKGKSSHDVERKGCNCGDCENFKAFSLTKGYYCAEGSAAATDA
jgi:aldose sugar dehydrogenase